MTDPNWSAYDDLQLRIDRDADGTYRTLALAPDGRTARGVFHVPLTDDELDDFVQRVGLVRRGRGPTEDRLQAIKEFGSSLFDALFADQVGNVYSAARAAASGGDRRLRITLHLSGAPELMRLPWEMLYHRPRFIAQSMDTPIIRTLDVDSARRPHRLKLPLRILGIASSPVGYQPLDAELERRNLETALEPLSRAGLVELTWLDRATLTDLGRRISQPDEIHVIHYIGHGAYSEENEAGILVLETPEGRAHDVTGEEIGAMLQDERALRLVVLNSCDGARTSHIDPFSGVATSLIEFDIPAVVGMQFEITDLAAIAFSESLYTGLAHGMPIDAAVGPARRAIMAMHPAEFGTPVLFLRDGDARLFDIDIEPLTGTPPEVPPGEPLPDKTTPVPPVEPPPARTGIGLWVTAFALALGSTLASLLLYQPSQLAAIIWISGTVLAAVFGAIAVGVTAVRHRTRGVLLATCSVLVVVMPFVFQASWPTTIASVLQIAILFGVLLMTNPRRGARTPRDNRSDSKRP